MLHGPHCRKLKVFIYSTDIPEGLSDFTSSTTRYWDSLFHRSRRLISLGRMQRFFLHLKPFPQYPVFVPPSTHYCCVARGIVDSKLIQGFTHDRSCRNRTLEPLISGPTPEPLGHVLIYILAIHSTKGSGAPVYSDKAAYRSINSFPVPAGTQYCLVARGSVDEKITQCFYT